MKKAEIIINDFGGSPIAEHNMPCPICLKHKAVYDLSHGFFQPCWVCQNEVRWMTVKAKGPIGKWFIKWITKQC